MHESTLARALLGAALDATAEPDRIVVIRGWIAEDEALSADALQLHFDALARGTRAEGARLALTLEHVSARCDGCGATYLPEHHLTLCPACGATEATLLGRTGLGLEAVDVR